MLSSPHLQNMTPPSFNRWLRVRRKALNLHRAAVPIEVCHCVPASKSAVALHGPEFGPARPYRWLSL